MVMLLIGFSRSKLMGEYAEFLFAILAELVVSVNIAIYIVDFLTSVACFHCIASCCLRYLDRIVTNMDLFVKVFDPVKG